MVPFLGRVTLLLVVLERVVVRRFVVVFCVVRRVLRFGDEEALAVAASLVPRFIRPTIWDAGTLFLRALVISFVVSSSTSRPVGARATNLISVTWDNSLRIKSPPRSPSRKAMIVFVFASFMIEGGILVPSTATTFFIPARSKANTSARPSTTIMVSDS